MAHSLQFVVQGFHIPETRVLFRRDISQAREGHQASQVNIVQAFGKLCQGQYFIGISAGLLWFPVDIDLDGELDPAFDRLTAWVDQQLDPGSIDDTEAALTFAASYAAKKPIQFADVVRAIPITPTAITRKLAGLYCHASPRSPLAIAVDPRVNPHVGVTTPNR